MKIIITTPSLNPPHGGIRIICEWANRLLKWHEVTMHSIDGNYTCDWFKLDPRVKKMSVYNATGYDCLIITSPHSIHLADRPDKPHKVFLFMQMLEHLFRPNDKEWYDKCVKFYTSPHPMMAISDWNIDELKKTFSRTAPTYYIGNGVNLHDFPIEYHEKDGNTILVEGWECGNPSKDIDHIGPETARYLKRLGYRIIAYSHLPLKTMPDVPDEYYCKPDLETLNDLYRRATIMIKASLYDARSCAPVEAMTKGTVTVRAIQKGDDDLRTMQNSIVLPYDKVRLTDAVIWLLQNKEVLSSMSAYCRATVPKWKDQIDEINKIISHKPKHKTVIVSVVYQEPEWKHTKQCIEATKRPVVYVDRAGVGSLAEALNRGFQEALAKYDFDNVWFVTNVTFQPGTLEQLETEIEDNCAAVHPRFESDHAHIRAGGKNVPFVEFTAPLVRAACFMALPLDQDMPYWGHDLEWGHEARELGWKMDVSEKATVKHVYIRNSKPNPITMKRLQNRRATDLQTTQKLEKLYGKDWRKRLYLA